MVDDIDRDTILRLLEEYAPDHDVMCEDSDRVRYAKEALAQLDTPERIIMVLYAEARSIRKLAAQLGCTEGALTKELDKIRLKIYARFDEYRIAAIDADIRHRLRGGHQRGGDDRQEGDMAMVGGEGTV